MKLAIHSDCMPASTVIPNCFFDTYMPKASGEFLKVYLYLYRWHSNPEKEISIVGIADILSMTEGDVIRALKYWQKEKLLSLTADSTGTKIFEITMLPIEAPKNESNAGRINRSAPARDVLSEPKASGAVLSAKDFEKPMYTMNEISDFSVKNDGDKLFFVIQQYLGRPLTQTDINTIVFFHEKLGFSIDLIEYLFEYCVSNNHRSIHYIEKVAVSWASKGIKNVSSAKAESTYYNKTYYSVLKAFGITGRGPAEAEIIYIKRWHEDYCFPLPLILEACRRTMLATHNPSFEYTDQILKNWKSKNVTNMADVQALDTAYETSKKASKAQRENFQQSSSKSAQTPSGENTSVRRYGNRFGNFDQRVYNYNELEQKLAKKIQGQ